jgi:phosphoserine phosphatase
MADAGSVGVSRASSERALFDWDGTVVPNFTIQEWLPFLSRTGVVHPDAVDAIERLIRAYAAHQMSHDDLSARTSEVYATSIVGVSGDALIRATDRFVAEQMERVFPYAPLVLARLRELEIECVVVSGAPEVVLRRFAQALPISAVYGLDVSLSGDGGVEPVIVRNPGVAARKAEIVAELSADRAILTAFGNSISDRPLLEVAGTSFLVDCAPDVFPDELASRLIPIRSTDDGQRVEEVVRRALLARM